MLLRPRPRPRRARQVLAAAALLTAALPACASAGTPPVPATPPLVDPVDGVGCPAVPGRAPDVPAAEQFADSVGVATHLAYDDTPYADRELVRERMLELGVRHYRDGWASDDAALHRAARKLGRDGLRVTFVHDPREGGTPEQQHADVRDALLPVLEAAESLNERDTRGGDWVGETISWTTRLSEAYRADPLTRDIPLIAPSLSLLEDEDAHRALSALQGTVDHGNAHDYPGKDLVMNDRILDLVQRHTRLVAGDVPPVVTETGYSDGPAEAPYQVMTPDAVALLVPRLLLEHFRAGVERTFLYELLDEDVGEGFEDSFGLVEQDGRPKASFRSLQSLLSTLTSAPQRCDQLPLELTVEEDDDQLRTLLLRGGEGTYHLALWRQVQVWAPDRALDDPPVQTTVRVRNPVGGVLAHVPHLQTTTGLEMDDGTVHVPVSGAVTVLELNGVGPAPLAAPSSSSGVDG